MHRCIGPMAELRLFIDMVGIMKFPRAHPMGVLFVTSLLTVAITGGMVLFYPQWVDERLIDRLGSSKPSVRGQAILESAARARVREPMKRKLLTSLDTESDTQFFAVVSALNEAGMFKTSVTNPLHIDRAIVVEFATAPDPNTQIWLLTQIINKRRDNRYIHQALKAAAASESVEVRIAGALLAAMLKDDEALGKLLDDEDPAVRAAAALDAGLAGRRALGDALIEKLADADAQVAGGAAAGLAYLDPTEYGPKLCKLLTETKDANLRERLCQVMTILNNDGARQAVGKLLASTRGKRFPAPMTLRAAGRLANTDGGDYIRTVLASAVKDRKTARRLVHAAIVAAGELELPVRTELYKICQQYWNPNWRSELMFAAAARVLGRLAAKNTGQADDAPTRRECENLLVGAAYYVGPQPTTGPAVRGRTTPIASAAAATAFWLLNPSAETDVKLKETASQPGTVEFIGRSVSGARVVMDAAQYSILAGDYIAWRVGRSGRPEAFKLGLRMLPPLNAPAGRRVYNENLRGAGAMMLAFAAKTDEQKQVAIQRITERLEPGKDHNGEDDPVLAGRYRCALLLLGDRSRLKVVREQRNDGGHAVPAAFTALIFAGEIEALDYLLSNTHIPARDVALYMTDDGLDRVLAARAPSLPTIDAAAPAAIQLWQAKILQDYYVLHRGAFSLGAKQ
jgi:hypothetical protein